MNFLSDTISGIHPDIMEGLNKESSFFGAPYGNDDTTKSLNDKFSILFEKEVTCFPVVGGTVGNCLAMSSAIQKPYGKILCHEISHINLHECGAPEFFTGGASIAQIEGNNGKINLEKLKATINNLEALPIHDPPIVMISITQSTDVGTIYTKQEINEISKLAKNKNIPLHMDGARFANSIATLGCSPADITWKAGVDILTFGATKNGAMMADAVIFFDKSLANDFLERQKRSGHLLSKLRFVSAQLDAYIKDDLWLKLAKHANEMASRLREKLEKYDEIKFCFTPETNQIFVLLPEDLTKYLEENGALFVRLPNPNGTMIRLVTNYETTTEEINSFLSLIDKYYS